MLTINPLKLSIPEMHSYLLGAVVPRPIAFVSSMDKDGNINLSPFSFFNVFSARPPILVFSPARRVKDNSTKHTLDNVLEHPEVVINIVDYAIVEQMSLSSTEYERGINEFEKAGLTMGKSQRVKPPRVEESPIAFECKVNEVKALGEQGGAGNMVICEVLLAHFDEGILNENQKIDPMKIDAVSRLGGNWYSRLLPESIFEIAKPIINKGIGVDTIPQDIRNSKVLTGNDLGKLGNVEKIPDEDEVAKFAGRTEIKNLLVNNPDLNREEAVHRLAQKYLADNDVKSAWLVLLQNN